jgi:hypothetical protein
VQEIEEIPGNPDVERHQRALSFLTEIIVEVPVQEYAAHLPTITHVLFLGTSHARTHARIHTAHVLT